MAGRVGTVNASNLENEYDIFVTIENAPPPSGPTLAQGDGQGKQEGRKGRREEAKEQMRKGQRKEGGRGKKGG